MPFVQRVVQPTRLAQVAVTTNLPTDRFQCMPGKCKNKNCINKIVKQEEDEDEEEEAKAVTKSDKVFSSNFNDDDVEVCDKVQGKECNGGHHVKDADTQAIIATKAIVHNNNNNISDGNGEGQQIFFMQKTQTTKKKKSTDGYVNGDDDVRGIRSFEEIENISLNFNIKTNNNNNNSLTNGCSSFTYGTDTEDTETSRAMPQSLSPLKKLKQHVEFLQPTSPTLVKSISSMPLSPITTTAANLKSINKPQQQQPTHGTTIKTTITSKSSVKLVTGYEFESISNITLSNALRQLASLVLLASDIFDDLHHELQNVAERTKIVHHKIIAVEQRVTAYDPKLVTVRKYFFVCLLSNY